MNKVKKSVSILLSLLMVLSLITAVPFTAGAAETDKVSTSEICGDYWYYLSYGGTATITKYNGNATALEIPSSLDGHTVTNIGDYAFNYCTSLTSVTIPDNVTIIGDNAFCNCTSLISITIPDSVTSIGFMAFYECTSLTSITIPDGVTSIEDSTFEYCTSLTSITIGNGVISIGSSSFDDTGYYNDESNWENGVLYIGNYLIEADGNTVSGEYKVKDGTKVIGDYAFYECTDLTSVTISDSVIGIGYLAFNYCESLANIGVDTNNQYYTSIDGNLYNKDKTELIQYAIGKSNTDFTIPDSVTSINNSAFESCNNITSVTIPDSVTSIGNEVFGNCTSLVSVTIPNSVTSIGSSAFEFCYDITSVTIPDSVTSIGYSAFSGCLSLTSITISDSVKSIEGATFSGCDSLTSVTIPDSVKSIGDDAFGYCTSLKSVTIPNSVTSIGYYAFTHCTSLKSVTIPYSVTRIGEKAFGYYYDYDNEEYEEVYGFTISSYTGSEAEKYAKNNGFKFVSLGKAPNATTITLKKSSGSVYVKGTTNIKATVKNGKGTTTYKSSNSKVAKVSKTGKVTGLKKGTAKITVANNGVKKTFKITVKNPKLSKKTVSVKKGKTTKVKIIGKIKGVNNKYINTRLAKVTSKKSASTLTIKGLKKGNTTLKIKVSGVTLKLKVKVK